MRRIALMALPAAAVALTSLYGLARAAADPTPAQPAPYCHDGACHPRNPAGYVTDGSAQPDDLHCTGPNRLIAQCMVARWGWVGDQWACLDHRITDIENHDWLTEVPGQSDHEAFGIPQARPGWKMGGPNYVEIVGGGYQGDYHTDPLIQVAWMRWYIRARYGVPCSIPQWGGY